MIEKHTCPRCGIEKLVEEFPKNKGRKNGIGVYCTKCHREYSLNKKYDKVRWETNRGVESARNRDYRSANSEELREKWRSNAKRYRDANPALKRKWNIARKYDQTRATPKWADMVAINAVYMLAKSLKEKDGVERHVDHIVPIKHELVCGLHVHWNLQVLTAAENMRKKNSFSV